MLAQAIAAAEARGSTARWEAGELPETYPYGV
jgi:hypothetical protein